MIVAPMISNKRRSSILRLNYEAHFIAFLRFWSRTLRLTFDLLEALEFALPAFEQNFKGE